jgi:hypothetical protein
LVSQDTELKKLQEKIKKKGKIIMIPDKEPVNTWSGNSSNMTFDFDFLINSEDELLVLHTNKAGVQTALKLNIDYTIHQTGNADGSYIIFPILGSSYKTLGEGEKITLMLDIPIAQNSPYGTSDKLNLKSLEFSLDYIVRLIQMVNRKAERSVKVQEGSSVTPDDLIESLNQAQINANNSAQQAAASASSASYYAVTAAEEAAVAAQKTAEISEIAEELEALDFADPDLSNITDAGKQVIQANRGSDCLTQSQVTNCVLESPRKINVEINSDGQLVLKAGSVVVYPDSATKTFKEYTTTRDYVSTGFNNRQQTLLLAMQGGEETWGTSDGIAEEFYCSTTTPVISGQYAVWLNLETFETKFTNDSGSSWQSIRYSMPFVIATCSASAYTSIDSVLDNFTFFGTYLMVRDDVKVLAPSGRNQDGTLNNKLITSVMSGHNYNFNGTTDAHLLLGNEDNSDNGGVICAAYYDYSYNNEKNTIQLIDTEYTCALCGEMKIVNSRITYLKEKETLRVGDSGPVVVETYHNGRSWYRIWSDGWMEQGGYYITEASGSGTVTLIKPYSSTDYAISVTGLHALETLSQWHTKACRPITKNSFNIISNQAATLGSFWETSGY